MNSIFWTDSMQKWFTERNFDQFKLVNVVSKTTFKMPSLYWLYWSFMTGNDCLCAHIQWEVCPAPTCVPMLCYLLLYQAPSCVPMFYYLLLYPTITCVSFRVLLPTFVPPFVTYFFCVVPTFCNGYDQLLLLYPCSSCYLLLYPLLLPTFPVLYPRSVMGMPSSCLYSWWFQRMLSLFFPSFQSFSISLPLSAHSSSMIKNLI